MSKAFARWMTRYRFQAQPGSHLSFEDFLRKAELTGINDPGEAMLQVLERVHVPGLNPARIRSDAVLNPCGPKHLLPFSRHICAEGHWAVNLDVRID